MNLNEIKEILNKEFFQVEKPVNTILLAIARKENCILYGPPGHAKSALVERALKLYLGEEEFYKEVYLTNGGLEMPTGPIVGVMDLKAYRETGKENYDLTETIYLKNRFAIIEEGLDMPGYAMETMKQPLMSRTICVNGTCLKNKLETLFICTNHNPVEWAGGNDSLMAAIRRFPHRAPVKLSDYSLDTWVKFFTHIGKADDYAAQLVAKCHEMNYFVAPREAVGMQQLVNMGGIEALENYDSMAEHPAVYAELVKLTERQPFLKDLKKIEKLTADAVSAVEKNNPYALGAVGLVEKAVKELKTIPTDGSFTNRIRACTVQIDALKTILTERAAKNPPVL